MKLFKSLIFCTLYLVFCTCLVSAQTLNVQSGSVLYQFPAYQAGEMLYSNATTLTIEGKVFNLSDIDKMYVDNTTVTNNTVSVEYGSNSAGVVVAGNVAQYLDVTVSGAQVSIIQSESVDTLLS